MECDFEAKTIEATLQASLPGGVHVKVAPNQDHSPCLYPEELEALQRAVEKRRLEYSTGRWLARSLLQRLGINPGPLLNDAQRVVRWPNPAVGSISHSNALCGVMVADSTKFVGLGLDLELQTPLEDKLFRHILTPNDQELVASVPEDERNLLAKAIFSAKEAAYKAHFPTNRQFVALTEASVSLSEPTPHPTIVVHMPALSLPVRTARIHGHFVSWAVLEHP